MIAGAMCGGDALYAGLLAAGVESEGVDPVNAARQLLKMRMNADETRDRFKGGGGKVAHRKFVIDVLAAFDANYKPLATEPHTITLLLPAQILPDERHGSARCVCVPSSKMFVQGAGCVPTAGTPKHTIRIPKEDMLEAEQCVWLAIVAGCGPLTWMVGEPAPLAEGVTLWGAPCGNVVGQQAVEAGLKVAGVVSVAVPTAMDARPWGTDVKRLRLRLEATGASKAYMLVKYDNAGAVEDITLATQCANALRVVQQADDSNEKDTMVLCTNGALVQYGEPTLDAATSIPTGFCPVMLLSRTGSQATDRTEFLPGSDMLSVLDTRANILTRHLLLRDKSGCVAAVLAVNNDDVRHAPVATLMTALAERDATAFGDAFNTDAVTSDVSFGGILPTTWVYEDKRLIHPHALLSGAAATRFHAMVSGVGVLTVTNRSRGAMIVLASELKGGEGVRAQVMCVSSTPNNTATLNVYGPVQPIMPVQPGVWATSVEAVANVVSRADVVERASAAKAAGVCVMDAAAARFAAGDALVRARAGGELSETEAALDALPAGVAGLSVARAELVRLKDAAKQPHAAAYAPSMEGSARWGAAVQGTGERGRLERACIELWNASRSFFERRNWKHEVLHLPFPPEAGVVVDAGGVVVWGNEALRPVVARCMGRPGSLATTPHFELVRQ